MSEKAGTAMTMVQKGDGEFFNWLEIGDWVRLSWMRENPKQFSDGTGPMAAELCQAFLLVAPVKRGLALNPTTLRYLLT